MATSKKAAPAKQAAAPKASATKAAVTKTASARKSAASTKAASTKKAASTTKAAPAKKATSAKKATPAAKKAASTTKAAPAKKTASTTKAAPAKKAAPATKRTAPAKKATPATKKAAPAPKKAAPAPKRAAGPTLAVKADETPWSAAELAEVRGLLDDEIGEYQRELAGFAAELEVLLSDSGDGSGDDHADAGAKTLEREQEMALLSNAETMLRQAELALARLDAGTYGVCESCGNPIGKERLKVFPRATLCVTCKAKQERY